MLLARRKRQIERNAAPFLEEGEEIRLMAMTQTGATAFQTAARATGPRPRRTGGGVGTVHALAATDRNVYAFLIPGWSGVGEVAAKVPIGEAEIEKDGGEVRFAGATFNVLFFAGRDAKRLVEFVKGRQATVSEQPSQEPPAAVT